MAPKWKPNDPRRAALAKRNRTAEARCISSRTHKGKEYGLETRNKIRQARLGKKASVETCKKLSQMRMGHSVSETTRIQQQLSNQKTWASLELRQRHSETMTLVAEQGGNRPKNPTWRNTVPEQQLANFLGEAGFCLEKQKRFGRFSVDVYVPEVHLAFEADGLYWHEMTERDRPGYYDLRDQYLLTTFGLPVVRLTDRELAIIGRD